MLTTEYLRKFYAYKMAGDRIHRTEQYMAEFEAWLASVKAEAWAECQAAMDERQLLVDVSGRYRDPVANPYLEKAK